MYQKLQPSICLADLCLWFGFLKESFLNPVKWLDEVDGGGAGEDAPGGGGGDVGGLGAAPWRDEAEEAGAPPSYSRHSIDYPYIVPRLLIIITMVRTNDKADISTHVNPPSR